MMHLMFVLVLIHIVPSSSIVHHHCYTSNGATAVGFRTEVSQIRNYIHLIYSKCHDTSVLFQK